MDMKHLPENIVDDRGTLARREAGLPATRTQLARLEPEQLHALDKIAIEGLEVFANHGVFPEENKLGQKFVVSVTLYTDTRRAGETDDLSVSIHYGEAAHAIDEFMRVHTFKLIETRPKALPPCCSTVTRARTACASSSRSPGRRWVCRCAPFPSRSSARGHRARVGGARGAVRCRT